MSKGAQTRQLIITRAAPVFNRHGFAGTSLSELMAAVGMEKGGIYNHFSSKEALALAVFEYVVKQASLRYEAIFAHTSSNIERLALLIADFQRLVDEADLPGGCPIFNLAVEADDGNQVLRARAQEAMRELLRLIGSTVKAGIAQGEIRPDTDPRAVATMAVSALEGAVVLSRLLDDHEHIQRVVAHLTWYVRSLSAR